jgi:hypothetical protein
MNKIALILIFVILLSGCDMPPNPPLFEVGQTVFVSETDLGTVEEIVVCKLNGVPMWMYYVRLIDVIESEGVTIEFDEIYEYLEQEIHVDQVICDDDDLCTEEDI